MKLYHGTTLPVALRAAVEGLKPRREHNRSNWEKAQSHRDGVYLTDAYPVYFAVHAMEVAYHKFPADHAARHVGAVVEVETDRLNPFNLVPDEDVLEQVGRVHDGLPKAWKMRQRTAYYRGKLRDYATGEEWVKSLAAMGTCAYLDTIPAAAITRIALIDNRVPRGASLMWEGMQPLIALVNYKFMADKYRTLTAHVFEAGAGVTIQEVNP